LIAATLIVASACTENLLRSVNHLPTIQEINEKATTWRAGHNHRFDDLSLGHVKNLLGAFRGENPEKLPMKDIKVMEDLPTNFDLREQWPQCQSLQEVRDQSNCGSCWAFGAAEAMSDRICIASEGKLQTRISTENLVACCSACGSGCNGGWPSAAWNYFKRKGLPTGGLYHDNSTCQPYSFPPCEHHTTGKYQPCGSEEFDTPTCSSKCVDGYPKSFKDDLFYAESTYQVPANEKAIMTELYQHGSLEVDFEVYADFVNYKSGIYQHTTGGYLGGHAIKLI
jgi:cathepsin B